MRALFIIFLICFSSQIVFGQTKERDSILNILDKYSSNYDAGNMMRLSTNIEKSLEVNTSVDSLYMAKVLIFKAEAFIYKKSLPETRKAFEHAIQMCPKSDDGIALKIHAILHSLIPESLAGLHVMEYKKIKRANALVEQSKNLPPSVLLHVYRAQAVWSQTLGEDDIAAACLDKLYAIFKSNEAQLSLVTKTSYYTFMMLFHVHTNIEETQMISFFNAYKRLYENAIANRHTFDVSEYLFAQTKIAEFYINRLKNREKNSAQKALYYLNSVLDSKEQNSVSDHYKNIAWYLKNEVLLIQNKLEEALENNSKRVTTSKQQESRIGYTLMQRIRLLLRLKKIKEAQKETIDIAAAFHLGDQKLKKDFSNFKTFQAIEYVEIFVDLADEFYKYGGSSIETKKVIAQLNKISLIHFKNSIDNKLTSPKLRNLFERIISNFIKAKEYNTRHGMITPKLLETIENIENTLDWQEFLQNRESSEFAFFDDYKYEKTTLRKQLVKARKKNQDSTVLALELKLEQVHVNFKEQYPNHSKLALSNFKITNFQNKLDENEVVLRYENIQDSLYVFVIDKNDVQLLNLGVSSAISTQVNNYIANISNRKITDEISKKLYQQLIPPTALLYEHLNIVPDNYLFKLPFEALKSTTDHYILEDKTILYTPYLSLLQHDTVLNNENQQDANLIIFTPSYTEVLDTQIAELTRGNEYRLNGAKKESELLANLFDNASFSDYAATKENFKKYAPKAQLLHLSMHASLNSKIPELSYLLFTEGNTDNKLYIEELYGMNLKADMAVLSACNTGDGRLDIKKGMISLHRAFTQAGVSTTVASLWSVPDNATQKIMFQFYTELKAGKTKAKALQLAKLHYLKTTDDSNFTAPFYWAGFTINGTNNPIIFPESKMNTIVWVAIGIAFLLLIWLCKKMNVIRW